MKNSTASLATLPDASSRRALGEDLLIGVEPTRRRRPSRSPVRRRDREHGRDRDARDAWQAGTGDPVRLDARGRTALRTLRRPAHRDPLPLLTHDLRSWQSFGPGLAHDRRGLDLYFHALEERERRQDDLARLPRGAAVVIGRALAVGDRAFTAATVPDELGLLRPWTWRDPLESRWWWSRVPARGPVLEALQRW